MSNILSYNLNEFIKMAASFHGSPAPGVLIGGFMVDYAYKHLPKGGEYDVICETSKCLPDAVQLLTPCSIGNQWLKIVDVGRYALTFYEKHTGRGIRVYLDWKLLEKFPQIKGWYLKLIPKKEQDADSLLREIMEAGSDICSLEEITVIIDPVNKRKNSSITICPSCEEAYRSEDGAICPGCQGGTLPYSREKNLRHTNVDFNLSA